jgi:hypothetical protein
MEVYATSVITLDGTVSKKGCEVIGGTIVIDSVDAQRKQSIELCKFDNQYFRTVNYFGCLEEGREGKNPSTEKVYIFPTPCDLPKTCDDPNSWGNFLSIFYYDITQIEVDGKKFDVLTTSRGALCNILKFNQNEKSIVITTKNAQGAKASIDVIIPNELLGGEFKVLVDGNDAIFNIKKTAIVDFHLAPGSISTITTELSFAHPESEIEIIGTQVVPEFPSLSLIALSIATSFIIGIRLIPKIGRVN